MKIRLPEQVSHIIHTIENAGFEGYAVGGCVRDSILGKEPADWDITTSAPPSAVKQLFRRTIDTGIRHGTVTVMLKQESFEVTTYRIDGFYTDGRHPDSVTFTPELSEDLKRRDFTINAMAYNDREGLIDLFSGEEDLRSGIIRAVGDPRDRFREDALRILRAFRFAARLGFRVETDTASAAAELADTLALISAERIRDELQKLITSDHPERLLDLREHGITAVVLPEFDRIMETPQNNPHHCFGVGEHTVRAMMALDGKGGVHLPFRTPAELPLPPEESLRILRLALLFHDMGKPDCRSTDEEGIDHFHGHPAVSARLAEEIMKRLKYDNRTVRLVSELVRYHDVRPAPSPKGVRRAVNRMGHEVFSLLFPLRRADILAQSDFLREEKLSFESGLLQLYRESLERKDCVSLKELCVKGSDLMKELGLKPGPGVGTLLTNLLELVLEDPSRNERQYLLEKAGELLQEAPGDASDPSGIGF